MPVRDCRQKELNAHFNITLLKNYKWKWVQNVPMYSKEVHYEYNTSAFRVYCDGLYCSYFSILLIYNFYVLNLISHTS